MNNRIWNDNPTINSLYRPMPEIDPGDPWEEARNAVAAVRRGQTDPQDYHSLYGIIGGLPDGLLDELLARVVLHYEHGPNRRWWWVRLADGQLDVSAYSRLTGDTELAGPAWRPTRILDQALILAKRFVGTQSDGSFTFGGGMQRQEAGVVARWWAEAEGHFVTTAGGGVTHTVSQGAASLSRAICQTLAVLLAPADIG